MQIITKMCCAILITTTLLSVGVSQFVSAQQSQIPRGQAAWSPDGQFIAVFYTEPDIQTLQIFSADLRPVASLQLDDNLEGLIWTETRDLAWSPDSTALAAVFIGGNAEWETQAYTVIWDTDSWTPRVASSYQGVQLSWSPSGSYLAVGAIVIDAFTGLIVNELLEYEQLDVNWVVWHPTHETQMLLGFDQQINIYQPFTGEIITTYPYSGVFRPAFTPDGQYLAVENGPFTVDIVDISMYQRVGTVEPTGSLAEPFGIRWLTNTELALTMINTPLEIWDPFTNEIVDTVSVSSSAWNPQGTQFLLRSTPLNNPLGRPPLAVYDRVTEGIVVQLSSQSTVQRLSLTDQTNSTYRTLLAGTTIINDISTNEAVDAVIEAFTYPDEVGSVVFDLNGTLFIDNSPPYMLSVPSVGTNTLSVTPYSEADAQGEAGLAFIVVIRILEDTATPMPLPPQSMHLGGTTRVELMNVL